MVSRRELAIAAVLVVFGGAVIAMTGAIEPGVHTDPLGPRAFPIVLGAAIALCGLLLGGLALLSRGQSRPAGPFADPGPDKDAEAGPFSLARLVGAVVVTAAYVAAFQPLGHLLATPPYVAAILLIHGGASRRALLVTPLLITIVLYATFRFGLLIPVPDGVLAAILPG